MTESSSFCHNNAVSLHSIMALQELNNKPPQLTPDISSGGSSLSLPQNEKPVLLNSTPVHPNAIKPSIPSSPPLSTDVAEQEGELTLLQRIHLRHQNNLAQGQTPVKVVTAENINNAKQKVDPPTIIDGLITNAVKKSTSSTVDKNLDITPEDQLKQVLEQIPVRGNAIIYEDLTIPFLDKLMGKFNVKLHTIVGVIDEINKERREASVDKSRNLGQKK